MNRQKTATGRGIEWTDHTWNVIGGCAHQCRWEMPDGKVAICYAEAVAEGVAIEHYPQGFAAHYWHPRRLREPLDQKTPGKIFCDSMADLFGVQVPEEHIRRVLDVMRQAHWHTFQVLTKNAPRIRMFRDELPPNLWVGVSSPPDWMFGNRLTPMQQHKHLERSLHELGEIAAPGRVTWMSAEPLSWDISRLVFRNRTTLRWCVIGAATNGHKVYLPDAAHVRSLLEVLDGESIPVWMKGNLHGSPAADPWREEFPVGY